MSTQRDEETSSKLAKRGKNLAKKGVKTLAKVKGVALWKVVLTALVILTLLVGLVVIIGALSTVISNELKEQKASEENAGCSVSGGSVDKNGLGNFEKNAKGGALEGKSDEMVKIAKKHNVPPKLFVAITASESQWGKGANATKQKNPLSVMGAGTIHDTGYSSIEEGLEAGAKNLDKLYISKGLTTPEKIGPKYAPTEGATNDPTGMNKRWIPTVKSIMKSLGDKGEDVKVDCSKRGGSNSGSELKGVDGKFPKPDKDKFNLQPTYPYGQCTWYVHQRRHQIGKDVPTTLGNGQDWGAKAKEAGFKVNKTPKPGAGACVKGGTFNSPPEYGHIMFVEKVKKDGSFVVSESNVKGLGVISYREFSKEDGKQMQFIHDK